jgi:hypothetical protein
MRWASFARLRSTIRDGPNMGSNSKKRTTMAKLNRETRLRERRFEKQARKAARKLASADQTAAAGDALTDEGR